MKPEQIEHIASRWVIREEDGLTDAERKEMQSWMESTSGAGEAVEKMRSTWDGFEGLQESDLEESRRFNKWQILAPISVAAALVLTLSVFSFQSNQTVLEETGLFVSKTVSYAENDFLELEDESTVELNAGTIIDYRFTDSKREVWIGKGEAYFSVAHDENRPFMVHAGKTTTRAVGTEFNVRYYNDAVDVVVAEGRVLFSMSEEIPIIQEVDLEETAVNSTFLDENQGVVVMEDPLFESNFVIRDVSKTEVDSILSWKPVTLRFDSTPLADVVDLFNQHNEIKLIILDPELKQLKIAAKFRSNKLDGFVRLLEVTSGVGSRRDEKFIYLYSTAS